MIKSTKNQMYNAHNISQGTIKRVLTVCSAGSLNDERLTLNNWRKKFLEEIKSRYNKKNCYLCTNILPEEGCVARLDYKLNCEVFKQKSVKILEGETKMLDKGIIDIKEYN